MIGFLSWHSTKTEVYQKSQNSNYDFYTSNKSSKPCPSAPTLYVFPSPPRQTWHQKKRHARLAFLRSHLSRWCYITGITVSHYACVCVCFSQLICLKTRVLRQLHAISLLYEEIQSCDYSLSLDMLLRQPHRSLVDKDWTLTLLICRLSSEMRFAYFLLICVLFACFAEIPLIQDWFWFKSKILDIMWWTKIETK